MPQAGLRKRFLTWWRTSTGTRSCKYKLQVGDPSLEPQVSGRQGFSRLKYQVLNVDDPVIPTTGQLLNFRTQYFNAIPEGTRISP